MVFCTTEDTDDCMDAGGRQKTAPAFSAFATSLWFSNAGAVAENTEKSRVRIAYLLWLLERWTRYAMCTLRLGSQAGAWEPA